MYLPGFIEVDESNRPVPPELPPLVLPLLEVELLESIDVFVLLLFEEEDDAVIDWYDTFTPNPNVDEGEDTSTPAFH